MKVRFLSTFINTAPSTRNHDWNNIGDVPVSPDPSSSSSDPVFHTADNTPSSSVLPTEDTIGNLICKVYKPDGCYVRYNHPPVPSTKKFHFHVLVFDLTLFNLAVDLSIFVLRRLENW